MSNKIKDLMYKAIEHKRPAQIENRCLEIWNQPFFYQIDKAKVLTISYNPTDKGARTNYPHWIVRYKKEGHIPTEQIYDLLYNFKMENNWRKNYNLIFKSLGFSVEEISHMDVSFFPYKTLDDYKECEYLDDTKQYLLSCIDLLKDQLKIIFVDGKKNRDILWHLKKDFSLYKSTKLPVNSSGVLYDLLIYKHNERNQYLIYYGCFLYGPTRPSSECVSKISDFIKDCVTL